MAVKNARNFVRDVNTRKICYSFCHLEMAFPSPTFQNQNQAHLPEIKTVYYQSLKIE